MESKHEIAGIFSHALIEFASFLKRDEERRLGSPLHTNDPTVRSTESHNPLRDSFSYSNLTNELQNFSEVGLGLNLNRTFEPIQTP